jgi:hypothetical protein
LFMPALLPLTQAVGRQGYGGSCGKCRMNW